VLDKAKEKLTSAISEAEEAMKNEKDAKTQIGTTDIKSIKLANAIKELFGHCEKCFKTTLTTDELSSLKKDIEAFKDGEDSKPEKKEA